MVFSFFKKPPEKMVAKPSVAPRSKDSGGADVGFAPAAVPQDGAVGQDRQALELVPLASDFSDFVFSEALQSFHVEAQADPVAADAEEAAMLYANRQDEAARAVLESAIHKHAYGPGERLWLMLFDLYRFRGDKAAFEALELDYAQCFEKSPPAWLDKSGGAGSHAVASGAMLFPGALVGENTRGFQSIGQALVKSVRLKLDLCEVKAVDSAGCERLLSLILQARKSGGAIELLGRDALGAMLQAQIVSGVAENQFSWLLFLELCQLQGQQEIFEDVAVDYAVTFEVSPPSWEAGRVAVPEPVRSEPANGASGDRAGAPSDAYVLEGETRSVRFADLLPYAESRDSVVIDCSNLVRMDFISAGALQNVLSSIRQRGKPIIFHQPNRLVAELFGIVGLSAVANLVFAKY